MGKNATPLDHWQNALQLGMMTMEANAVIGMRIWGMAGFWAVTDSENQRMISEKAEAAKQGMMAAGLATMKGQRPDQVLAAAIKPVRRKTRANSKRLAKRGPKLR
ncbi:hypothetical protein [Litoreibacter janthinus]|uniref:Antifreeze protein n=1 Tax=Litoreibacter janthinus TaxID=670154 RepID=A0A1I6FWG5_9RHOB|nr:hypothetical protein [Litoreibacter janthinus]SFR34248.1 hypothetical protein SAMN04488002_0451 [Litoreibacter janthinus]